MTDDEMVLTPEEAGVPQEAVEQTAPPADEELPAEDLATVSSQDSNEVAQAVELRRQLLNPATAPYAVREIMRWAQEQGYWQPPEEKSTETEKEDAWSRVWEEDTDTATPSRVEELARRVQELEARLAREQEREAVQAAVRYVMDIAKRDQVALSREEGQKIVEQARRYIHASMDDRAIAEVLELCYNKAVVQRQKQDAARRSAPVQKQAAEVQVQNQAGVASDYEARVEAIIRRNLKS